MITFKQFISEEAETVAGYIEEHCKPFLEQSNRDGFLYRGMTSLNEGQRKLPIAEGGEVTPFSVKTVRKYRQPMTMNKILHHAIDRWFDLEFGIPGRSATMFCAGREGKDAAAGYGRYLCAVFPIGEMKALWSPKVDDLWVRMEDNKSKLQIEDNNVFYDDAPLGDELKKLDYRVGDLQSAMNSKAEIMIDCDKYVAVVAWGDTMKPLSEALRIRK